MSVCPRCRRTIDDRAVTCSYCGITLKAYGHPGIPLYRAETDAYLCETCVYHADDSCTFPQRPYAQECTLYQTPDREKAAIAPVTRRTSRLSLRGTNQQIVGWLVVISLIVVSFILAAS